MIDNSVGPLAAGLAVGIAFIVIFSMLFALPVSRPFPGMLAPGAELENIEKVPAVALFLEKYGEQNSTIYFGYSENGTAQFMFAAAGGVDKDGNGYKETSRTMELDVTYDGSGGKPIYYTFEPERVKHMEAHCKELVKFTININEAFADVMPPAYDGDVRDFIQNSECFS